MTSSEISRPVFTHSQRRDRFGRSSLPEGEYIAMKFIKIIGLYVNVYIL